MKRKIHSIVYHDEGYESKIEKLWIDKKIREGDIVELIQKSDKDLKKLDLVLIVINQYANVPDNITGIYCVSQVAKRKIQLSNYRFPLPIDIFVPGSLQYNSYKLMLQNAGAWREKCKDWEIESKLKMWGRVK